MRRAFLLWCRGAAWTTCIAAGPGMAAAAACQAAP
jgi:hypothetical protein